MQRVGARDGSLRPATDVVEVRAIPAGDCPGLQSLLGAPFCVRRNTLRPAARAVACVSNAANDAAGHVREGPHVFGWRVGVARCLQLFAQSNAGHGR